MNVNEVMLNPVRMRIIQELSGKKSATANELCEVLSDIPRTTLYRHIKVLIENDIISVVSEEKIRGSYERTLALNIPEIAKYNTIENAKENAFGFLMSNYIKFHNYFEKDDPDPAGDRIFLNNTVLMMNDEEFDRFIDELRKVLIKYSFGFKEGRKARDISILSAPVQKD